MDVVPIGSITVFVNTRNLELFINQNLENVIVESIVSCIRNDLKVSYPNIIITEIRVSRGCILIEFVLSAVKNGYNFVKDFPELLSGIKTIFEKLKGSTVKTETKIVKDGGKPTIIAEVVDQLPEILKNISPGQQVKISGYRSKTSHKVAIFRDDLIQHVEYYTDTQSESINITIK